MTFSGVNRDLHLGNQKVTDGRSWKVNYEHKLSQEYSTDSPFFPIILDVAAITVIAPKKWVVQRQLSVWENLF